MKIKKLDKILLIIITTISSLYFIETYLFFLQKKIYEERKVDTLGKINFYKKGETLSVNPSNHLISKNLDFLPLSGISNKNTIYCNEQGYYAKYYSDRYGFNNSDRIWDSSVIDFLMVGDSFVQGACVDRDNNFSGNLTKISDKKVLNLGMDSNGPLLNLATLKEYAPKNKIKNILWFYYEGNDLEDLDKEFQFKILKKYLSEESFSQRLLGQQSKIDNANKNLIDLKFKQLKKRKENPPKFSFKFYYLRTFLFYRDKQNLSSEFRLVIESLKNFTIKNEINLYFVYLPENKRYNKLVYLNDNYKKIKDLLNDLNINFIDLHEELFKNVSVSELFSKRKNHYSEKGYRLITSRIHSIINKM